ncbi:mandelate racemase/muconate lactonizing enzyme family protein [Reyranella sp. CPCC 100927]|uniref:mandelate racemase/muconate lactonizing enzyme family protein n=1 Tax=Reyranella sp. CPCC 100927 TaxID=2599616 RepID=UPI0011B62F52|nr:mandelate racemase/muconate lactonizing enzyme family protein [Reyranella sp. CPCC 100927]TWT11647.1 mandelate racemase/muconate lactonizing enzyme family protein [Reyranella sp. CPCC 100927]
MRKEIPIERMDVIVTAIPASDAPPEGARWYGRHSTQLLVKLHSQGIYGVGEGFAYGAPKAALEVIETVLAPVVLQQDAASIDERVKQMARATRICGRSGIAAFAVAAIEIALWDLLGKARGVPVHELLGGARHAALPAYASLPRFDTPQAAASESVRLATQGFTAVKLHQTDVASVIAVRQALGENVDLMLDTNCAWTEDEAVTMARALEPARLAWLEEPVWPPEDYKAIARVRASTDIPISLGENEYSLAGFEQCLQARATDFLQPSVAKLGILAMTATAAMARAASARFVPHSFYFGPGLAATAHVLATLPEKDWMELPAGDVPVLEEPLVAKKGTISLPRAPGLGIVLNEDMLQRHCLAQRVLAA